MRGSKGVRKFYEDNKWLYADLQDLKNAEREVDHQISYLSKTVPRLIDDNEDPDVRPRTPGPSPKATGSASTQTAVGNLSTLFSTAAQSVTLTATVSSSNGGTVKEGNVTFTLGTLPTVTGSVNAQGVATAPITLPASFAIGTYPLAAHYADTTNSKLIQRMNPIADHARKKLPAGAGYCDGLTGDILCLHDGYHRHQNGDRARTIAALDYWLPR